MKCETIRTGAFPKSRCSLPRRRQLPDGTIETLSAAMGRCIEIPAAPIRIDLSTHAEGWEGLTDWLCRWRG
jgi:hypothetical protein